MGTAMLQAVRRRMKRLTLKREPVHPTLNEHLWALVLQHLDTLQDRVKASTSCRAAWKAGLLKLEIPVHLPIKGWEYVLRRGCTATSLSLPGHQSTVSCFYGAMQVLTSQSLYLYDIGCYFPRLEQITIGGKCLAEAPKPVLRARYFCSQCQRAFSLQNNFRSLLTDVKVVNMVAPILLETSQLLQGGLSSSFTRLRHLTLMIDPLGCYFDRPSQLNTSMAEIGNHSQLESLYIGFIRGFGSSAWDGIKANPEDSIDLRLSSMHMQHLKSVHLDSFWPALLELPPRASLHATFKSAPGQKYPGLWAGRLADVLNPWLPLKSVHFLPECGLGAEHAVIAKELWPLKARRSPQSVRIRAGTLNMALSEFPGLMQAEAVLIAALECTLRIQGSQEAIKHLEIRVSRELKLAITDVVAFAAQVESLTIISKDPMGPRPLMLALDMRDAMLAAGKKVITNCRYTLCQPKGKKNPCSYGGGNASLGVGSESIDVDEWAHTVRCCCHACLACLHREGAAAFPEAIAQEKATFEV